MLKRCWFKVNKKKAEKPRFSLPVCTYRPVTRRVCAVEYKGNNKEYTLFICTVFNSFLLHRLPFDFYECSRDSNIFSWYATASVYSTTKVRNASSALSRTKRTTYESIERSVASFRRGQVFATNIRKMTKTSEPIFRLGRTGGTTSWS